MTLPPMHFVVAVSTPRLLFYTLVVSDHISEPIVEGQSGDTGDTTVVIIMLIIIIIGCTKHCCRCLTAYSQLPVRQ
jgi:hypothetical protein